MYWLVCKINDIIGGSYEIQEMVIQMIIKDRYKLNLTGKQKSMLEGLVNAKKMR